MRDPFDYLRTEDVSVIWDISYDYLHDYVTAVRKHTQKEIQAFINEVKFMSRGKKSNDTGNTGKTSSNSPTTWLSPHIPAAEGRAFVAECGTNLQYFSDTVAALCTRSDGFTISQQPDGSFRGFVFFTRNSGDKTHKYGVRSDSATSQGCFIGLLYKFVHLLECGENPEFFEDDDEFDEFK